MISTNLKKILDSISLTKLRYNRTDDIELVAVSKYSDTEEIFEAFLCSQMAFGENKVQDLSRKKFALLEREARTKDIRWHFIGTLQDNKINALLRLEPSLLHSLHSLEIANGLQRRLVRDDKKLRALLQINSSNEDSKSGFCPESAFDSYLQISETCPNIILCGVMCMGANTSDRGTIEMGFIQTQSGGR